MLISVKLRCQIKIYENAIQLSNKQNLKKLIGKKKLIELIFKDLLPVSSSLIINISANSCLEVLSY